jgi:anti-sigma B factor antagonist
MASPLECEVGSVRAGEPVVVFVRGEVDLATAADLSATVRGVFASAPSSVILDLEGLAFIDSSGLRELVTLSEEAGAMGASFVLRNVPRVAQRVLELTGLTDWFEQPPGA